MPDILDVRQHVITQPAPDGGTSPLGGIAICCSGGGIRSAAFNLGALQEVQSSRQYAKISTITAVSGGSYIAAGHALAEQHLAAGAGEPKAFSLGSPEESHLRCNSRYLFPDGPTTFFGVSGLLSGLAINVALVAALLFLVGHVLGWLLRGAGVLTGLHAGEPHLRLFPAIIAACVLLGTALVVNGVCYVRPHIRGARSRAVSRWAWRSGAAAVVAALLFVATPAAVDHLFVLGRDGTSAGARVVRSLGIPDAKGCAAAAARKQAGSVCGVSHVTAAHGQSGKNGRAAGAGFAGFLLALIGLVRTATGKLRTYGKDLEGQPALKRLVDQFGRVARDRLAPWTGTALIAAASAAVLVRWTADGAAAGAGNSQWWRGQWLTDVAPALLFLLLIKLFIDINNTSLHRYYRDRLADAYSYDRRTGQPDPDAKLSTLAGRTPELVICATANCIGGHALPAGRRAASFTYTADSVGLSVGTTSGPHESGPRASTRQYEAALPLLTLFDAVAVSGAAVAPVMGKMSRPSQRVVFALANVRLGVWLPAPERVRRGMSARSFARRLMQPDLSHLWAEMAGQMHVRGHWLYVTDGGHYDNLGLVEALRRRPEVVFAFDAAGDPQGRFTTLAESVALAREECQVDIDIDPTPMKPNDDREVPVTVTAGTLTYRGLPGEPKGSFIYARLGVTAHHPWDVRGYLRRHPTFPTTSTLQQMYNDEEFEAYRAMGQQTSRDALKVFAEVAPAVAFRPAP